MVLISMGKREADKQCTEHSIDNKYEMVNTVAAFKRKGKNLLFKKYLVVDHLS